MMPPEDLAAAVRTALVAELPTHEHAALVDRLAVAITRRILQRDKQLADAYRPTLTRDELLERLVIEAKQPVPRRPLLPARQPNLDTPDVVADRLAVLADMPDVAPDEAVDVDPIAEAGYLPPDRLQLPLTVEELREVVLQQSGAYNAPGTVVHAKAVALLAEAETAQAQERWKERLP